MKKIGSILCSIGLLGLVASNATASNKNEALTACKAHITGLYTNGLHTNVKKVRQKNGHVEVKMKVQNDGERFVATCKVASDGTLDYTTNRNGVVSQN